MRNIFIKKLVEEATKNKKIILIVGDLGFGVVEPFKSKFPNIIKEIRGKGLILGIQLHHDQTKFIEKLMKNKLLTFRAAENVIRVLPPLNVKKQEINMDLKII